MYAPWITGLEWYTFICLAGIMTPICMRLQAMSNRTSPQGQDSQEHETSSAACGPSKESEPAEPIPSHHPPAEEEAASLQHTRTVRLSGASQHNNVPSTAGMASAREEVPGGDIEDHSECCLAHIGQGNGRLPGPLWHESLI